MSITERIRDIVSEELEKYNRIHIPQDVFRAVCAFLPQIVNYVEEDRRFSFKIALGIQTVEKSYGDCYFLREENIEELRKEKSGEAFVKKITGMIRNVAPFCDTFTNVIIRYDPAEQKLHAGIYTAKQDRFRDQDAFLIERGYVLFSPVNDRGILVKNQGEAGYLPLDLGLEKSCGKRAQDQPRYRSGTCKTWDGLFERVRREVHGTICLVVEDGYSFAQDNDEDNSSRQMSEEPANNFMNGLTVPEIDIIQSEAGMDLFLSMLNYDGITIINTKGKILAYHAKSHTDNENAASGGMRHQAYEYLKNNGRERYVGLYIQSQEGEIKFYDYRNGRENTDFFDCKIMMPQGKDSDFWEIIKEMLERDAELEEAARLFEELRRELGNDLDEIEAYLNNSDEMKSKYKKPLIEECLKILRRAKATRCLRRALTVSDSQADGVTIALKETHDMTWDKYFRNREYLNATILGELKDPGMERKLEEVKKYFTSRKKVQVSFEDRFLCYNHLQFEDMDYALTEARNSDLMKPWLNFLYFDE